MQLLRPPDGRMQDAIASAQDPAPIDDSPGLLSHPVTLSFRDPGKRESTMHNWRSMS